MTNKTKILLSILSGALLSVAFPPFPVFIAAYFAFVPLFFVLNDENQNIIEINPKKLTKKFNKNIKLEVCV